MYSTLDFVTSHRRWRPAGPPPRRSTPTAPRAQAHIKLANFADAAKDAADATGIDPAMHRAFRRALVRIRLGQYESARAAVEAGRPGSWRRAVRAAVKRAQREGAEAAAVAITEVVVTVYAKDVAAEHVAVEFGEQTLAALSINIPREAPYHLQPKLFGKIIADKCSYNILPSKIEVPLAKAKGVTWPSLEHTDKPVSRLHDQGRLQHFGLQNEM
ncbi:hypothetical protein E2562_015536 [Oryza meyeriana var. granulata]|uniref:CS domain-containing protein n=1 Tax=Oryza meyeriana var. granulata TaxID=110450 RepID=A0A6G1CQF6_9ORYZ|nr:hypothetical protein E2562_015536 [Oryza meyeriana var. granulata]